MAPRRAGRGGRRSRHEGAALTRILPALLALFLVSGATGLVYQSVWARQLHLVFGTSTFAVATVLAAFMLGLGLGGVAITRVVGTLARPLRTYGWLEVGIGLWALAFPTLLELATPVYLAAHRALDPGLVLAGVLQLGVVGVLLVPPTAAMGATLPLLARFAADDEETAGDRVGLLYGVNTAGAVIGTALAGLVLLPGLGLALTTALAASGNLLLGVGALALDRTSSPLPPRPVTPVPGSWLVAGAMAVAGFASLVYEVAWTRVLALVLGGSTYAFTVMLVAFLFGIGLGGRLGGPLADTWFRRGGRQRVLAGLAGVEALVGLLSYGLTHAYDALPWWYVAWFDVVDGAANPVTMWLGCLLLAGVVLVPPAVLMGVAFPVAVRAAVPPGGALGAPVGRVYAANTFGSALGAALAGFLLLPALHIRGTVAVGVACNLAAAAALATAAAPRRRLAAWGGAAVCVGMVVALPARWDPLWMTSGLYQYVSRIERPSHERVRWFASGNHELLFYDEGLSSVVTVAQNPQTGHLWLANNGKVDASSAGDLATQVLVSVLPAQHVVPRRSLVIGLASGITAGALSRVDGVESLEIVELEPAIGVAARLFDDHNHRVLDDPRTSLIYEDGRTHVLRAAPGTWDLVVSQPSNPWISGVSNLFTREFFELGRTRLAPGGVWCQWVQSYALTADDVASLLGTFADVYPHVHVYATDDYADLLLIGANHPIPPTLDAAERLLAMDGAREVLAAIDIDHPVELLALYEQDRDGARKLAAGIPRNTDDNLHIEYAAPLQLHTDPEADVYARLVRAAQIPWDAVGDDPLLLADLADAYAARNARVRAVKALGRAVQNLPPGDPLRTEWEARGRDWLGRIEEGLAAEE